MINALLCKNISFNIFDKFRMKTSLKYLINDSTVKITSNFMGMKSAQANILQLNRHTKVKKKQQKLQMKMKINKKQWNSEPYYYMTPTIISRKCSTMCR